MRILYRIVSLCVCVSYAFTCEAYSSYPHTNLVHNRIKPNTMVKSKPHSFSVISLSSAGQFDNSKPVKFASVNFIAATGKGYGVLANKDDEKCAAYPYTTEAQLSNCATFEECKNGYQKKAKCTSCRNNMTLGEDGRCSCNKTNYAYNEKSNPCPYGYDETQSCKELGNDNVLRSYYKTCTCPSGWTECSGRHQIGLGVACVSGEKSYYYICGCESNYQSSCANSRPLNATDYCINLSKGGERNYAGCYQCELSSTSNYSLTDWWDSICSSVFTTCGD